MTYVEALRWQAYYFYDPERMMARAQLSAMMPDEQLSTSTAPRYDDIVKNSASHAEIRSWSRKLTKHFEGATDG